MEEGQYLEILYTDGKKGTLLILDHEKVSQHVVQKEPSTGMECLGVYLALDRNNFNQFNALHAKVQKWSANITKSYVSRFAADLALQTTIMHTVEYPLAATTFTTKQCNLILRPILKATFPKLGIARTIGRKYLHGPYYLQGNTSQIFITWCCKAKRPAEPRRPGYPTRSGTRILSGIPST